MPALPRGSRVEVQPLLLAPPGSDAGSFVSESQPLRGSRRALALNPAAAARGEASPALAVTRALFAPGRLCRVHASVGALAIPDLQVHTAVSRHCLC